MNTDQKLEVMRHLVSLVASTLITIEEARSILKEYGILPNSAE